MATASRPSGAFRSACASRGALRRSALPCLKHSIREYKAIDEILLQKTVGKSRFDGGRSMMRQYELDHYQPNAFRLQPNIHACFALHPIVDQARAMLRAF